MKITDMAMIALIVFFPIVLKMELDTITQSHANEYREVYNYVIEAAAEDATRSLINRNNSSFEDLLNSALNRYYETIYTNFNIENDPVGQEAVKMYFPYQMVIGEDGYYVHVYHESMDTGDVGPHMVNAWMPKVPYSFFDTSANLIINFTLSSYCYVFDADTAQWYEGPRSDMSTLFPASVVFSIANFENVRLKTIVDQVRSALEYYSYMHNQVALKYGYTYQYNIPYIDDDALLNTIKSVSFIGFAQGMPVGTEYYSTYGFGGARISINKKYYGNIINLVSYYHEEGCPLLSSSRKVFVSKKDAASNGYYPCQECRP